MVKGLDFLKGEGRELDQSQRGTALSCLPCSWTEAMSWRPWIDLEHHLVKDLRKCMNGERKVPS